MGAWQEASKDLHNLLDVLADHKVAALGLARGREATENERAQILSGYRRTLSTTAARANSGCLLGRLAKVGEAHPQRGGKEKGVGPEGGREAARGEESPLESPCPGQRSESRRVCVCCVNCNYFEL